MRKDEKRILKLAIFYFISFEILIASVLIYIHYRKYHYVPKGDIVAKIYGEKIYSKEIESRMDFLMEKFDNDNLTIENLDYEILKALLLEQYVDKKILELAKDKNIYNNPNYRFLANEYKDRLIVEDYLNNFVFNNIDDDTIKKRYDELLAITDGKEERKISHILVETEDEANRIRNTILRRNNFERMARTRSLDTATAIKDGSLGYVIKEELAYPEFSNVAFLLKKGEISKPIQTKEGWHLIRVDDIRNIQTKSFEDSKVDIYYDVRQETFDNFLKTIIDTDDIDNHIEIFIDYKPLEEENEVEDELKEGDTTENIDNILDGVIDEQ